MNAMVPGLAGSKMSSSDPNSKIDFLDTPSDVKKKIKTAFCEEGNITENGVLSFVKVLISISNLRAARIKSGDTTGAKPFVIDGAPEGTVFSIARPEKYGGPMHFESFEKIQSEFAERKLHPGDLKLGVQEAINSLLAPIQKAYNESPEFQAAALRAYPPPPEAAKAGKGGKKVSLSPYSRISNHLLTLHT